MSGPDAESPPSGVRLTVRRFKVLRRRHLPQLWAPPTPPAGDDDVYVDETTRYLYASKPMEETALPPVYVRKSSSKRMRTDANHALLRKMKAIRSEGHGGPKSLFDRPTPVLIKMRKEARLLKLKRQGHGGSLLGQRPAPGTPPVPSTGPSVPQLPGQVGAVPRKQQQQQLQQQQLLEQQAPPEPNQVEWTVNEDYGLVQASHCESRGQYEEYPSVPRFLLIRFLTISPLSPRTGLPAIPRAPVVSDSAYAWSHSQSGPSRGLRQFNGVACISVTETMSSTLRTNACTSRRRQA